MKLVSLRAEFGWHYSKQFAYGIGLSFMTFVFVNLD